MGAVWESEDDTNDSEAPGSDLGEICLITLDELEQKIVWALRRIPHI